MGTSSHSLATRRRPRRSRRCDPWRTRRPRSAASLRASTSGLAADTRITGLAVDPALTVSSRHDVYWQIKSLSAPATDPAIVRLVRQDGSQVTLALKGEVAGSQLFSSDGFYVYWTDSTAIFRLSTQTAAPQVIPTPLSTTDVSPDLPYGQGSSTDDYLYGSDPGG